MEGGPESEAYIDHRSDHILLQPTSAYIDSPPTYDDPASFDFSESAQQTGQHMIPRKPRLISTTPPPTEPLNAPTFPPTSYQRSDSPRTILPQSAEIIDPGSRHASWESHGSNNENGNGQDSVAPENVQSSPQPVELSPALQYHHRHMSEGGAIDAASNKQPENGLRSGPRDPSTLLSATRPQSSNPAFDLEIRGRGGSPGLSPNRYSCAPSLGRHSPDARPLSYVDLLNVPYPQPAPAPINVDNAHLRTAVGSNASLLSTKKTLEMYRANVKKTNDSSIQYSFAIFMLESAQEASQAIAENGGQKPPGENAPSPTELVQEARQILQRLADKSYPFAQYYLADGYASGVFNKGKPDNEKAFPLFAAASKHGHAEAGYRAALCYEFGWGTRKDPQKAVQFFRQSASKNHPGAMGRLGRACLSGDLGVGNRYREGLKWLKRAAESADYQYNSAPYELGVLHETGYGDDIFQDETYAAQLFTQSADLGHTEANYRLGDAYEHGKLTCPRDPALSVHFYNGAASRGHPLAMMALCAWYMVGAEPILEKDENEAYEWAKKAAECGLPKAEYAVGYFTEMGIGCRRDPLEANVWYVRAADQGDERAKHRIAAIRAAASGGAPPTPSPTPSAQKQKKGKGSPKADRKEDEKEKGKKKWGIF